MAFAGKLNGKATIMFFGRTTELDKLYRLQNKKSASLVCVLGRRRIGKSALIQEFGKKFSTFVEIQGLGPLQEDDLNAQLEHFTNEINRQFGLQLETAKNWDQAFSNLAGHTQKGSILILMDEISWMGKGDKFFPEKLKSAWDTQFKKNENLVLVLCGSVSTWIEENILKNVSFVGRISLELELRELKLPEIRQFWQNHHFSMGSLERLMILSITGGVPKYLEEVLKGETAARNLAKLCFDTSGILYNDFDKIFNEIFMRRSDKFEKIVRTCLEKKMGPAELARKLSLNQDSYLSDALHILELSGFLSRDYFFKPDTNEVSKLSQLRVRDNYLRFYLKVIEPLKKRIEKGNYQIEDLFDLPSYRSILGYQFENIVLNNVASVLKSIKVDPYDIYSAAPYTQRKTARTKGACQIDLLIHSKLDVFYLCEIKCEKVITKKIIKEMNRKLDAIELPRRSSAKAVLIYEGSIHPDDFQAIKDTFFRLISFDELSRI